MKDGIEAGIGNAAASKVTESIINNVNSMGEQSTNNNSNDYYIGLTDKQISTLKKVLFVLMFIFIAIDILFTIINFKSGIRTVVIINIVFLGFAALFLIGINSLGNSIEIVNGEIFKVKKNNRKSVGRIEEISTYFIKSSDIIVYNQNNKEMFQFRISGKEDNERFYLWLKDNKKMK